MLWNLLACVASTADDGTVLLRGSVYEWPLASTDEVLAKGRLTATDLGGQVEYPSSESSTRPGYYSLLVPAGDAFRLRINRPGYYPSVWAGLAPESGGSFLPLYGMEIDAVDGYFAYLETLVGGEIDTESGERVQVWGRPLDAEGLSVADLVIRDGQGFRADVFGFHLAEQGHLLPSEPGDPVDYFFAFNLAPGNVEVLVIDEFGQEWGEDYATEAGDIVAAFYFQGP